MCIVTMPMNTCRLSALLIVVELFNCFLNRLVWANGWLYLRQKRFEMSLRFSIATVFRQSCLDVLIRIRRPAPIDFVWVLRQRYAHWCEERSYTESMKPITIREMRQNVPFWQKDKERKWKKGGHTGWLTKWLLLKKQAFQKAHNASQDQRTMHPTAWRFFFQLNQDKHLQILLGSKSFIWAINT